MLEAAKKVLAVGVAHASVASIAACAGVGIAGLYRRHRSKDEIAGSTPHQTRQGRQKGRSSAGPAHSHAATQPSRRPAQ
ncbi:TetR family transcriptional regulator [Microtetraspora niveoalba]|uniref:TetR family transcriptional regulator n=1 Tax=Microtetraspora niveoalba TaxID=46175 RepID=UPI00278C03B0|nr:TetR family transcriptional regulator [Microtetraspora niveoalba]